MSEVKATVYLLRNNSIDLSLLSNDTLVDLDSITKIELVCSDHSIDSITRPECFRLTSLTYGNLRLILGSVDVDPGIYNYQLVLYDNLNILGIVWGNISISYIAKI